MSNQQEGIPEAVMRNTALVQDLADVAKDSALLHGVLMRTEETPNSSEVIYVNFFLVDFRFKTNW